MQAWVLVVLATLLTRHSAGEQPTQATVEGELCHIRAAVFGAATGDPGLTSNRAMKIFRPLATRRPPAAAAPQAPPRSGRYILWTARRRGGV